MAAAEPHLVTPGGALGDDAAPPDVRLVPGDAEDEEYEEPDPPLRPSACTGIGRLAASPLLGVARIAAAPFRILGRRRESLENEAAQLREKRKELAAARDADDRLRFNAGNIAIHLLSRPFVEEIVGDAGAGLPWHRAVKAMPVWDSATGHLVEPQQPNAVKLERFVFDVLARAQRPAILRVQRHEEFAPIKNAEGDDSPATSGRLQSDLHGGWLASHGVEMPRDPQGHIDASVEIGPLTALACEDLQHVDLPTRVDRGESILL